MNSHRWGIPILDEGHTPVYNFMLRHYAEAGVTRAEFLFIIHLASYKYESPQGEARPALATISAQMGYSHQNSVRNLKNSLVDKGLLEVVERAGKPSIYDFTQFSLRVLQLFNNAQGVQPSVGVPLHPNVAEEEKKEESSLATQGPLPENPQPSDYKVLIDKYRADYESGEHQPGAVLAHAMVTAVYHRNPYSEDPAGKVTPSEYGIGNRILKQAQKHYGYGNPGITFNIALNAILLTALEMYKGHEVARRGPVPFIMAVIRAEDNNV